MNEIALVLIVTALIVTACLMTRRRPRHAPPLKRLNAGVAHKAEWMATEAVVQRVAADYLDAQDWIAAAMQAGYGAYLRDLPRYLAGESLAEHERRIKAHMRKGGPRLIGILRANHRVQVRRFSDDGLTCIVIDHQTGRRMATYDYWSKRRLHTQDLGDGALVYRMTYTGGHWKITEWIQQLPSGWDSASRVPIRLMDELPVAAGRDI